MATASTVDIMTLGPQQKTMTGLIQPAGNNGSCVIVAAQSQQQSHHLASPHQAAKSALLQQKRPIAPADARASVAASAAGAAVASPDMLRCKRRINFSHGGSHVAYAPGHQPASVARRNARERNRVKQVNNGFATLRSRIPLSVAAALSSSSGSASPNPSGGRGASKKLSKVETLRMAVEYIRSLQQLLEEHAAETGAATTPLPSETGVATPLPPPAPGSDTGYYSSSPESGVLMGPAQTHYQAVATPGPVAPLLVQQASASLSPPCSEASSSPTPSYASEGSGSAGSSAYAPPSVYQTDAYENYEPMSPEDEELLDAISWWQQSQ